jgi:G3E family GTPase
MVTVVDAPISCEDLPRRETSQAARPRPRRRRRAHAVADLLIEQVEFANVIVINKSTLSPTRSPSRPARSSRRSTLARGSSPRCAARSRWSAILDTRLFDADAASTTPGWLRELRGEHTPETEEYGISSLVYQDARPFDAQRLWDFFQGGSLRGILRSKGFFWVAAEHRVAYEWAQAGGAWQVNPLGTWWAAVPRDKWPHADGERPDQRPNWDPRFGDRIQQLVFIGQHLDKERLRAALDACLLDEPLIARGSAAWQSLHNPFPPMPAQEA